MAGEEEAGAAGETRRNNQSRLIETDGLRSGPRVAPRYCIRVPARVLEVPIVVSVDLLTFERLRKLSQLALS
jgi:hypothetical protein